MSLPWRTVSLFVSSTFRDTQLERDILVRLAAQVLLGLEPALKAMVHDVTVRVPLPSQAAP